MVFKLGLIVATPFVLLALVMGASGVVVVDVREGGDDGMHLMIPVPLALAQAALTFAPDDAKYVECPEFAPYQDVAEKILEELDDTPDFVMVEIEDGQEKVLVQKVGNKIEIDVEDGTDEQVHVNLPIESALKIIRSYDGRGFPTKAAIWSLRKAHMGTLVHVTDGEDEVTIRRF